MTQKELDKVLSAQGITKVFSLACSEMQFGVLGDEFNPNIHEAMFQMPLTEGAKPNSLGQIITVGYMFKQRVLRPCMAGVYMKESETKE